MQVDWGGRNAKSKCECGVMGGGGKLAWTSTLQGQFARLESGCQVFEQSGLLPPGGRGLWGGMAGIGLRFPGVGVRVWG